MVTKQYIEKIAKELERDNIERTVSLKDTDKFCQAICAFANDFADNRQAGYLLLGVKDNGELAGLKVTDRLLLDIADIRSEGNILPQPAMTVSHFSYKNGDILVVEVQPSKYPPVRYRGRVWIRVGPRKAIANETEDKILTERRKSAYLTFDEHPVYNSSLNDLNINAFKLMYLPNAVAPDILENDRRDAKMQLASLHFYDLEADRPTVAGLLMFARNLPYFLPGAYIQYVRFDGETVASNVLSEQTIDGNLISVVQTLDSFIKTVVVQQRPVQISTLVEKTVRNYPPWAIRELMMNALMHRSYETNVGIKFYQFSDRLEIINPGGLFGSARPDNFPFVNDYRNLIVAGAMKTMGYVNKFNRGIETSQEYLKDNGNPPAVFDFEKVTVFGVKIMENTEKPLDKTTKVAKDFPKIPKEILEVPNYWELIPNVTNNVTEESKNVTENVTENVTKDVTEKQNNVTKNINVTEKKEDVTKHISKDVTEKMENVTKNVTKKQDNVTKNRNVTKNVTEKRGNVTKNTVKNVTKKESKNRESQLIALLRLNNKLSAAILAKQLKVSKMTVLRNFDKLKNKGIIIRVGTPQSGHWEIV
jgi:ATP-dependent DNA helicase RecG